LLDTTVVRSLLVPALAYDLDRRIWWPSRLDLPTLPTDTESS
jgi:RND superfamily putative drug exporter